MLLVASLVLFHDWLGASLSLALQTYLLGLVTLFWGLMKMLNQGSGDRETWAAFALGALHFFLGALLLLTPSLPDGSHVDVRDPVRPQPGKVTRATLL
jgi:hypothetical protein